MAPTIAHSEKIEIAEIFQMEIVEIRHVCLRWLISFRQISRIFAENRGEPLGRKPRRPSLLNFFFNCSHHLNFLFFIRMKNKSELAKTLGTSVVLPLSVVLIVFGSR